MGTFSVESDDIRFRLGSANGKQKVVGGVGAGAKSDVSGVSGVSGLSLLSGDEVVLWVLCGVCLGLFVLGLVIGRRRR